MFGVGGCVESESVEISELHQRAKQGRYSSDVPSAKSSASWREFRLEDLEAVCVFIGIGEGP